MIAATSSTIYKKFQNNYFRWLVQPKLPSRTSTKVRQKEGCLNLCKIPLPKHTSICVRKKDALIDTQQQQHNIHKISSNNAPRWFIFSSHGCTTWLVVSRHQLIPEIHITVQYRKAQKLPEIHKPDNWDLEKRLTIEWLQLDSLH